MKSNSPNRVDGDVQALIQRCQKHLQWLKDNAAFYPDNAESLEEDRLIHEAALAALTAEPVYQLIDDSRWYDAPKYLFDEAKARGDECRTVYTISPAHHLRPVELPGGFSPAIGDIFDRQAPVMRRDREEGCWIHKAVVAELLRSLGHEVKND